MLGALMGHLKQAKKSASQEDRDENVQKRRRAEEKAAEKIKTEAEQLKKDEMDRIDELTTREQAQKELLLKDLSEKRNKVSAMRMMSKATVLLSNVIRTETSPRLYWAPKHHVESTTNALMTSRRQHLEEARTRVRNLGFDPDEIAAELSKDLQKDEQEEGEGMNMEETSPQHSVTVVNGVEDQVIEEAPDQDDAERASADASIVQVSGNESDEHVPNKVVDMEG